MKMNIYVYLYLHIRLSISLQFDSLQFDSTIQFNSAIELITGTASSQLQRGAPPLARAPDLRIVRLLLDGVESSNWIQPSNCRTLMSSKIRKYDLYITYSHIYIFTDLYIQIYIPFIIHI